MMIALLLASALPSPTPAMIETARTTLEDSLRDYAGSKFRGFRAVQIGEKMTLCGEINPRTTGGGLQGWRKVGIVVAGDPVGARLIAVATDGYTGLADFGEVCPVIGPTATLLPKGAIVGDDDITPALQPAAS